MKQQAPKSDHAVKCKTQLSVEGRAMSYATDTNRITMVPLVIRRRQTHKVIMPPPGDPNEVHQYTPDVPMIRTLGKAFYWRRLLNEGKYDTATQLARSLKLEPGWVAEVLRMTLLAPDIIEAIVNGRHPRHINLQTLRGRHEELTRLWSEQRRVLGFTA